MAAMLATQVRRLFNAAAGGYGCVLYEIREVNTSDTYDFAAEWRTINHTFLSPTTRGIVASMPAVSGTVVTFSQAGMVKDSGYLLLTGIPV